MKIFRGRIVAADKRDKTVTIQIEELYGVDGVVMGEVINIVPVTYEGEPPTQKKERQPGE